MTKWSCECCGGNRFDDLERGTKECWYCGTLYKEDYGPILSRNYQPTINVNYRGVGAYYTDISKWFCEYLLQAA